MSLILTMESDPSGELNIQGVSLVGLLVFTAYELGHKLRCAVAQQYFSRQEIGDNSGYPTAYWKRQLTVV